MSTVARSAYRLVAGSERTHRQADAFALARHFGKAARRHPRRYGAGGLLLVLLLGGKLVAVLLLALAVVGGLTGWERLRAERGPRPPKSRFLSGRRVLAGTGLLVVLGALVAVTVSARLVGLVALAAIAWLITTRVPKSNDWWSHKRLSAAMVAAGIVRQRAGERPPKLLYRGKPAPDEHGTAVTVALPPGVAAVEVADKRVKLAAALGVPARLLTVRHDTDDPANVVTLWVGFPRPSGSAPSPLAAVERTTWADPVRIGCDEQGRPVTLLTLENSTLVAGVPGAGKSNICRTIVAHALLDPDAQVYALDGKAGGDYRAAVPYFTRWVSGTDEHAPAQLLAMLTEVLGIVRARNAADTDEHPGLLLLLEEVQDIRAAGDKRTADEIDKVLGRIVRLGRACAVTTLISTQRPSVDDLPSGVRNLVTQRVCLMVRNPADAGLVLGAAPTLPLPTRRGEALLTTPAATRAVHLDHLQDAGWLAVCARTSRSPADRDVRLDGDLGLDLFGEAVRGLLRDGPLTATQLYEWLPAELQQGSVVGLGRALARLSGVERGHMGKSPVWRLDPSVRGMSHAQTDPRYPSLVALP